MLVADPGSGKTTRLAPALLGAGLAEGGEILVLEPRRLAARLAARRVAEELGERPGETVGWQVRFENVGSPRTRIRFLTEGILTRRIAADPELSGVSAVLLDEFHERHLHGDLALAWLRRIRSGSRPDLAIGVLSATLDADPVAEFLGVRPIRIDAPRFPVDVRFAGRRDPRPLAGQVAAAVGALLDEGLPGGILVFLPGAAEIRRAREAIRERVAAAGFDLVLLHGDLPSAEQDAAVRPGGRPKVVLSTNVAESSVTIEGIVAVVDSGLARIARTSPWSGLGSLEVGAIARSSADQRAGRAGRTAPGRCLRLYSSADFRLRPACETPEVRRADLAEAALLLATRGYPDPALFPWFEPPEPARLAAARELLGALGAVDREGRATPVGLRMAALPLHPRLARLLVEAEGRGAPRAGALAAALLGEREIRRDVRGGLEGVAAAPDVEGPSDLLERMEAFGRAEREGLRPDRIALLGLDPGATLRVARGRDQLLGLLGAAGPDRGDSTETILLSTIAAFPDRLARRRSRRSADLALASGGRAELDRSSVVREGELLVALEGEERRGAPARIRLASRVEAEELAELFPERIVERRELLFDEERERVEEVRSVAFEGFVLKEIRRPAGRAEGAPILAAAARRAGVGAFEDGERLEVFRLRAAFAASLSEGVPEVGEELLGEALERLAAESESFAAMRKRGLLALLRERIGRGALAEIDRLAPERIRLAGGRQVTVDWSPARPPSIASRLADFFGEREGPRIGGGRVPLVLRLLAPNNREVQVTSDLAGFWERHYPAIRRELSRRYPRHPWPEEPLAASPPAAGKGPSRR